MEKQRNAPIFANLAYITKIRISGPGSISAALRLHSMAAIIPEVRNLAIMTSKNIKWHVVASIALAGSNAPEEVPYVLRYALQHDANGDVNGQLARRIARETRDGLTKAAQLIGAVKTLDALAELSSIPPLAEDDPSPRSRESDAKVMSPEEIRARGWEYWQKIYTSSSQNFLDHIHRGYPDMAYWAISHVYGPMMSFFDCLDEMQTSFVMIASLIPGGHNRQIKGHFQGALNNGATKDEIKVVREIAIRMCQEAGIKWKTPIVDLD